MNAMSPVHLLSQDLHGSPMKVYFFPSQYDGCSSLKLSRAVPYSWNITASLRCRPAISPDCTSTYTTARQRVSVGSILEFIRVITDDLPNLAAWTAIRVGGANIWILFFSVYSAEYAWNLGHGSADSKWMFRMSAISYM